MQHFTASGENRRNYFRNQAHLRFRWRLVLPDEFAQMETFFVSSGNLPIQKQDNISPPLPIDQLTGQLRLLAMQDDKINHTLDQLLNQIKEFAHSPMDLDWNESYWKQPSLMDISGGGCSFPLSHNLYKPGDILELEFGVDETTSLRAVTRVVRVYYLSPHHWVCCRFELLSVKDRDRFIQFQTSVQRNLLKLRLEQKLSAIHSAESDIVIEEREENVSPIVETPAGNIHDRRKLVRVDDILPISWQVLSKDEAESNIAIFKKFGVFPNFNEKSLFDEKKIGEFEEGLINLKQYGPSVRDGIIALWEELDHLYHQVSPNKKQNIFAPLLLQLVVTTQRMSGITRLSSINADILKDYKRCLQVAFASDLSIPPRQLQKNLRMEFTETAKKFRTLYRIDPIQKEIIYSLYEHLLQVAEILSNQGIRTIFGHQPQLVNLSGNGLAFVDFDTPEKNQILNLRIGIPESPWRWISCIGRVVLEHLVESNRRLVRDGKILPQKRVAIQYAYIHPTDQEKLIAYVNLKSTEVKREKLIK